MKPRIRSRSQWLIGAASLVALAGCTHAPLQKAGVPAPRVEPVYRVQQPVGTAAGQYAVGRMELAAGRLDAAIMRFRQALQLDPALVEAHNALGIAYGQQGRFLDAAGAFRAGLVHAPEAPHLLNNLGYALMRAGQLDEAWASLDRAHRLDKLNPQTSENLVQLAAARAQQGGSANLAAVPAPSPAQTVEVASGPQAQAQHAVPAQQTSVSASPAPVPPVAASAQPVAAAPVPPASVSAQPAAVRIQPVQAPSASFASGLNGAVIVQSDQARLRQVAPGILELKPAATHGDTVRAEAAASAPSTVSSVAAMAAATVLVPPPAARSPSPSEAAQVIQAPPPALAVATPVSPASAVAPPAARLAAVGSSAPVGGFEVSNGVGIRNLAGRMARALGRLGVPVDRVSDYRWFGVHRTEIHYRDGHRDAAQVVAGTLPVKPRFVRSTRMQQSINVRLVVGRDLSARQVAWLGEETLLQADLPADAEEPTFAILQARPTLPSAAPAVILANADRVKGWRHF